MPLAQRLAAISPINAVTFSPTIPSPPSIQRTDADAQSVERGHSEDSAGGLVCEVGALREEQLGVEHRDVVGACAIGIDQLELDGLGFSNVTVGKSPKRRRFLDWAAATID